jgi:hypothetical protein
MTLDRIKTSTGRKLRNEALQETALPIPYDAAAMPGAFVLGTDGQVYVSQKDSPTSNYEWLRGIASVRLRTNIIQNISGGGGTPYAPFFQIEGVGVTSPSQSIVAVNGTATLVLGAVSGTEIGDNGALTPSSIASGALLFHGSDGTNLYSMARINCLPGGTFDTQVTPGLLQLGVRLKGSTAGIQNILRINGDGNVLIGNTTGTERLSVTGNIQLTNTADSFKVGTNNVVGSRKTGWAAPTGTATRTTFATSTVTTAQLAERLKALIDDLTSHGLIGA